MAKKENDKSRNAMQGRSLLRQQYPAVGEDVHAWWYGLFDGMQPFLDRDGKQVRTRRDDKLELWFVFREPAPGIVLVVIELRLSCQPLSLHLKCWIDASCHDAYESLRSAPLFGVAGEEWGRVAPDSPSRWAKERELVNKDVVGIRYHRTLESLAPQPDLLGTRIQAVAHEFVDYVQRYGSSIANSSKCQFQSEQ
ncbi:hypothetical protein ACFPAG_15915 [Vogesella sp. GCM10023246]|uniref:Uncharacterized protein n=1 Tax=Vogesella oryzagri TaxID=3160864 RepID=A0ABV1M7C8_9NEIS